MPGGGTSAPAAGLGESMSTSSTGISGTTSSSASTIFNGTSRFSTDFQNIITRSVAIANLPIQQLQNGSSDLSAQSTELTTLGSQFTTLQNAVQQLQTAVSSGSLAASSSDTTVAQTQIGAGARPGTFLLLVNNIGSFTNTISNGGSTAVSDPSKQNISSASSFTLTVNGVATTITPATSSLDDLVTAINSKSGLGAEASIVNLGSSSAPDYRLSVQSTELGPDGIQLNDGSSDLLGNLSLGSLASYQLDNLATPITSTSRTVTVSPGVKVTLVAPSAAHLPTSITVAPDTSAIQSALTQFVSSYNGTATELTKNTGSAGGALQGDSITYQLSAALQSLGSYRSGASGISGLTDLGITFNQSGQLEFDSSVFSSATSGQIQSLSTFLGTSTTGGFLQYATNALTAITDPTSGIIPTDKLSLQKQISATNSLILADQAKVNTLQTNLQNQIAASDALVASLEQNYNLIQGLFAAQQNNVTARSLA